MSEHEVKYKVRKENGSTVTRTGYVTDLNDSVAKSELEETLPDGWNVIMVEPQ